MQLPLFLTGILVSTTTGRHRQIRGKLLVGAAGQIAACLIVAALHSHSAIWLLICLALVFGVPQGPNSIALQNAVYHQAHAARTGSSAGLLRTFVYLGAVIASAADGAFLSRRADTGGLHHLSWFMLGVAVLFLAVTVADRSLSRIGRDGSVVLSTLRQAADLDFRLTVLADGCHDPDPQVHQVLTEKVFARQADVVTVDEWSKALG